MNEQNFHPYVSQPPAEPEATPAVPVQPEAPPPFPQADQQAYQYQPPQPVQPYMEGQTQYQQPYQPPYQQPPYQPPVYAPAPVYVPEQIKGWNWGAFALSWIWGVGNRTYIALLALVPGFSLIWAIVLGIMGNEWAWKTGNFASVEDFLRQQESWNRAGKIAFFVNLGIAVLYLFLFIPFFGMFFNMIRYAAYW